MDGTLEISASPVTIQFRIAASRSGWSFPLSLLASDCLLSFVKYKLLYRGKLVFGETMGLLVDFVAGGFKLSD